MDRQPKILVVDDEAIARDFARQVLAEQSYTLFTAVSGIDALVLLEQHPDMDLLLLDIMMPVMDGFEVLEVIQANPALAQMKIIMVSAMAQVADKVRAFQAGAHDYLVKPIEKAELLARLQTHIRLKQTEAALQSYNAQLEAKISECKRVEEHLRLARDEAETAVRAKSTFLANMSHEIRTPLNAVIGMTTLLSDTSLDPEQAEFVHTIRNSSDSLLAIINDILDYSKIEAGQLHLENHPFYLNTCLEEAIDLVAPKAVEKEIDLLYYLEDNVPSLLLGDVTRLRQVLVNLLSNAVKFTENGEVVVTVKKQADAMLHFAIRDTGIGIPPGRLQHLFTAFSQADTSTTRQYGGTGLGLAISKNLVQLMGGSIGVESEVGHGSTFHFTIAADEVAAQSTDWGQQTVTLTGKRVLIVDDNETNCFILSQQMKKWGMITETAVSAAAALTKIQENAPFDLAILDMQMPETDGITLAAQIRAGEKNDQIPLIMLSSLGQRYAGSAAVNIAYHLTKPVKQSQLLLAINSIFSCQMEPAAPLPPPDNPQINPHAGTQSPLRILLAEDNAINQKVALRMLNRMGYRADVAANGEEVLAALQRQQYDVILMDVQMPEMDGVTATKQILANWPAHERPRIIAMTANALKGDRENYLQIGMDDYISKPIRIDLLERALHQSYQTVKQKKVQSS